MKNKKHVLVLFLKVIFYIMFSISHVNTSVVQKANKDLISDMFSWHQNWDIRKIVSSSLKSSNCDRSNDSCVLFESVIRTYAASCCGVYWYFSSEMRRLFEGGVNSRESFNRINTVYKIEVKVSTFYEVSLFSLLSFSNINSQKKWRENLYRSSR